METSAATILASILRASNESRPVLLTGAGASFTSGVPQAGESVRRIAKRYYADRVQGGALLPEQVKLSEWQSWLHGQNWFIRGEDHLAENFPLVVEHLLQPREYRARILRELFKPPASIGAGYRHLADLVMKGLIRTILTTNFDECLETCLKEKNPHIPHVSRVNRGPGDLREFSLYAKAQIVWLHGCSEQYTDRNSNGEIEKLDQELVEKLIPLLGDSPLIVVGYRGAEPSVMEHLLGTGIQPTLKFKNGIYWCKLKGETLHPNVEALRRKIDSNLKVLEIDGFDELMTELAEILVNEDGYTAASSSSSVSPPQAFDDKAVSGANGSDLDEDLMLLVMRDYCTNLGRVPVTKESLPRLLQEQGLLVRGATGLVPTAGCILLFGKNPQEHFPHAVVSATIAGKKRSSITGNLITQHSHLLEWLNGEDVNPLVKLKRGTTHSPTTAYPNRALLELLVNLLVHRDYEQSESAEINVMPGVGLTFRNPGALPDDVARRVRLGPNGQFKAIANISSLRNRSLCDVFFGLRAMEREGTGLTDVESLLVNHGGSAAFVHDAKSHSFIAEILSAKASSSSGLIIRDDRPTGEYVINFLPFSSVPQHLSIIGINVPFRERPSDMSLDGIGVFLPLRGELWSFAPLPFIEQRFAPILVPNSGHQRLLSDVEANSEERKFLSWLLRRHFERHLMSFMEDGLIRDTSRKRADRVYFAGLDGKGRKYNYDTPRRKGITREVVKQRGDLPKKWFENEGFGFEVLQTAGQWGVRIKPFYMFTGMDGKKPLSPWARTQRSTRRMKLDRNKNVEDDLTFWGRFLSRGRGAINIGHENVDNLILEGRFLTFEIPEENFESVISDAKDRRVA